MKLSTFFLLVAILHVSANSYSQEARISFSIKNGTLTDVFKAIERQSDFKIFFKVDQVNLEKKIDYTAQNISINKVLSDILPSTGVTFDVIEKVIVITSIAERIQQKLTGTITDISNGDPIVGANNIY